MEALGRLFDAAMIADGAPVRLRNCSGVTFLCTAAAAETYTVTYGATSAAATDPGDIIDHYYVTLSEDGTTAWSKVDVDPANNTFLTTAGVPNTVAIHVSTKSLPDDAKYLKCTSTGAGLVSAILHDLESQRGPANMELVEA